MGLVAKAREFHRRDLFRRAAGFLQKHEIGLLPFQKPRDMRRTRADGIDVEGAKTKQGDQPIAKEEPQPQPELACGLLIAK
jgi:hypothetical protein